MELLEAMAELIGDACAVDHIIRDDSAPAGQCPFIRATHDKNVLIIERVEIVLCGGTVANVLTFVASFPVFSQRLPYKARQYTAAIYRYRLGIEGGQRLNAKASKGMSRLLKP